MDDYSIYFWLGLAARAVGYAGVLLMFASPFLAIACLFSPRYIIWFKNKTRLKGVTFWALACIVGMFTAFVGATGVEVAISEHVRALNQ